VFEQYSTEVFLSFDNARNIRLQKKRKKCSWFYGTNIIDEDERIFFLLTNKQYNMLTRCNSCGLLTSSNQHRSGTIIW